MSTLQEVVPELFTHSEVLILNFDEISDRDKHKNIQDFMKNLEKQGGSPRRAEKRQEFNESVLKNSKSRYLIGRYLEDRRQMLKGSHIEKEGRTFHLAVDVFSINQEPVFAPCTGEIVVSNKEPGEHNYGNYIIFKPSNTNLPYIFFGHLADNEHYLGQVKAGQQIAKLGHYKNFENGGWSIHLHLQLLNELPPKGQTPIGYSSQQKLKLNNQKFPDPLKLFPNWKIKR